MQINDTTIAITQHNPALQVYNAFVDVIRLVRVVTSSGTQKSETVIVSNMPCAIRWRSGKERILFNKTTYFRDATLRCRVQAETITTNDIIRHNGLDYEIVSAIDVRNLHKLLVIDIRRVE